MSNARNNINFDQIKYAEAQHIGYGGKRQTLEDRCAAREILTTGGIKLYVGIVADGIGGASAGETAGQLTLDTILTSIQESQETDVSVILHTAIQAAHLAVRNASKSNVILRSMGTTATLAAISAGKLYLAHIGDSRAYLVRAGKITQLTGDHTWGNEKVREGLLTMEEAARHPRREELARYVGQSTMQTLTVDVGLRLDGQTDPSKSVLVQGGLALEPGDVVVLCTDGLIKDRQGVAGHFVEPEEIVSWVQRSEPQDAVNTLVSLALGRQVDDNVSVVLLEAPGKKKSIFAAPLANQRSLLKTAFAAVMVGLIVLLVIILAGIGQTPPPSLVTNQAIATVPAILPEYGAAVVLTGALNYQVLSQNPQLVPAGAEAPTGSDVRLWTNSEPARLRLEDGSVIVLGGFTTLSLQRSTSTSGANSSMTLSLERGALYVVSGNLLVQAKEGSYRIWVNGVKLGVSYDATQKAFEVDCFGEQGVCQIQAPLGFIELPAGKRLAYQADVPGEAADANYEAWQGLCGPDCVIPTVTPTPTATMTPTATATPEPTLPVSTPGSGTPGAKDPNKSPGGSGGGGGGGGGGG